MAEEFYKKLCDGQTAGHKFPFDCPYQVAFVHCTVDEHWAVGILVMGGTEEGDSGDQIKVLHEWFDECCADSTGTEKTNERVRIPTVEDTLQERYGPHYRCVEKFGSLLG
jgi:hypothetical protein